MAAWGLGAWPLRDGAVLAGEDKIGIDPAGAARREEQEKRLAFGAPLDRAAALGSPPDGDRAAIMESRRRPAPPSTRASGVMRGGSARTTRRGGRRSRSHAADVVRVPPTRDATGPAAAVCSQRTTVTEKELDANPVTLATEPWRRVNAIRLLAIAADARRASRRSSSR